MDRLTTLMDRFQLAVQAAQPGQANLIALADSGGVPVRIRYCTKGAVERLDPGAVMWAAQVEWSGQSNPFLAALPPVVDYDITSNAEAQGLVRLMQEEAEGQHCGAQSVINRLGEVLMVRLLRNQIQKGATEPGLLAGLADPRLSRAIVAMHDHPGRLWTNADLAQQAGLSLSRFAELFAAEVGETPIGYLRRWRLILAHQDLMRGDRVEAVARRYAYASPEGFTRAFRKAYGLAPVSVRTAAA
ncbi:AraC family transcriptional regulator [Leisingera aquaemixtae]|uniref:Exoenzyme S synthesis regulatory protein ExsA n=1 Tax=Leisingera aquaemixtae TaxID=1396826 RepID=A0A0P1H5S6_9RHOB|nr:AraC family transcriptional regulator [Leisingera aquaemixtae]CUH98166.1 Exoenzyme S synthesis regulatory protein ExsA [Leisingera aquaemixtae]